MKFLHQLIPFIDVIEIIEEILQIFLHNIAEIRNNREVEAALDLFHQFVSIAIYQLGDVLAGVTSNSRNTQRRNQSCQLGMSACLYSFAEFGIGALAPAIQNFNLLLVTVQTVNVGICLYKTMLQEIFQFGPGQATDIHGVTAHKMLKLSNTPSRTMRIGTMKRLSSALLGSVDFQRSAAARANHGQLIRITVGKVFVDSRNNHIRLVDSNPIPCSQLQLLKIGQIVKRCTRYGRSINLDRLKHSGKTDGACTSSSHINTDKLSLDSFVLPLKCHTAAFVVTRCAQ